MSNSFKENAGAYLFILILIAVLIILGVTSPMDGGVFTQHHHSMGLTRII